MNDTQIVRRLEGVDNLARDREGVGKDETAIFSWLAVGLHPHGLSRPASAGREVNGLVYDLRQIQAVDQLHDDAAILDSVDGRNVWMIERRQRLRLAREPRHTLGIVRKQLWQDLDRHLAVEPGVAS